MTGPAARLSAELRALAVRLLKLADDCDDLQGSGDTTVTRKGPPLRQESQAHALGAFAELEYRGRRLRDELLGSDLFGEPAWDMLLDLYVNHARKRRVPVSALCQASSRPATTALRWIGELQTRGLVCRRDSSADNRVSHVELTALGLRLVGSCLQGRAHLMCTAVPA